MLTEEEKNEQRAKRRVTLENKTEEEKKEWRDNIKKGFSNRFRCSAAGVSV